MPDGTRRIDNLLVTSGSARLDGRLAVPVSGIPEGSLRLKAPELGDIAPLLLQRLTGRLDAELALEDAAGKLRITSRISGDDISGDEFIVGGLKGRCHRR